MKKQIRNSEATFVISVHFLICHTILTRHLSLILIFSLVNAEITSTLPLNDNGRNGLKNINKNIDQILHNLDCVSISNANIDQ